MAPPGPRPGAFVQGVRRSGDDDYALLPLKLSFEDGGAYALLGPSGCGKTTMLNVISGLLQPSQGSVLFDGRDVTRLSPQQRNIAQVFQFPVVYDTMTVARTWPFRCATASCRPSAIRARIAQIAEMLELSVSSTSAPPAWPPTPSRRSRSGAAWCARTSPRCCSTSR